ncbi:hypothetical protein [Enhygromyxa salina]|nr:hypothetical protein [Enhygromyxa salina]
MEKDRRRYLFNRCKPDVALRPSDDRYIDLDARRVRGVDWVARLASRIELSDAPTCQLFTGLPGSGKSTELLRLAERLELRDGANLLAVVVSAEEVLDLLGPIDVPDIVLAVVSACERTLLEAEGKDPETAMEIGYFARLWAWLTRTDVTFTRAEFSVEKVGRLTAELKTRPNLRQRFRETIGVHLNRFLAEVRDELEVMQGRAVALGHAGLVVIVDSLEKLRGTRPTRDQVLASAERVFSDGAPHLQLPVHTLYTIPTALVSRKRFAQVDFIPMIKLHQHPHDGGGRFQDGYDAAMQLLLQRVPERDLAELFGANTEARVEQLIEWSGGYPRELVRLLHDSLLSETIPLSDSDFRRLLNEVGDQYRKLIPADAFPWLARVATERYLTVDTEAQRQTADAMLAHNVVLRYLNDQDWFDLHPSVRQIPGVAAEIQRLIRP